MWFKISGGIYFFIVAAGAFGIVSVPGIILGIVALIAGIALIAGK